jgi:hypothetical protein
VTTTLSPPIRILALVGVLAAAGLGILLFAHNRSAASSSSPPAVQSVNQPPTHPAVTGTKPAVTPAKPKIVLLPGLPAPIAHSLRFSKVVVVSLYAKGAAGDQPAVAQARAGATSAHAGFVAVNVVDEKTARSLGTFASVTTALPAVLIVKRPGKIVNEFSGYSDSEIVAQAALNAGAGR